MTTTYKLVAFSRNVELPILPDAKHSGYGLVKYEDGNAVAMKTVEVTASSLFGNMNFASSIDTESGYSDGWIPVTENNGNIIPQKVFENGSWQETTSEWIADREYKVVPLKDANGEDISNPEDVYREIQNNADLLNQSGMSYDPLNQNCNTWTDYIDDTILGGVEIFDQLNAGLTTPEVYTGGNNPFPFPGSEMYIGFIGITGALFDYLKDKAILEQIEDLQEFLNSMDGALFREMEHNMYLTYRSVCYEIVCDDVTYFFNTPISINQDDPKERIREGFTTAADTRSPLVVDLDGDGVETTTTEDGTHFDHDNNGFAEKTAWVGKDDGLLVRDINGNGQIDNGTELFGNNSVLSSGEKAANGFEALADLDSNEDNIFNNQDTVWNQVKVWKDANSNGIVDEGELLTLEQANVSGINLDYENSTTTDESGNQHNQTGTFIKTDGTTGSVHDVWFDADMAA